MMYTSSESSVITPPFQVRARVRHPREPGCAVRVVGDLLDADARVRLRRLLLRRLGARRLHLPHEHHGERASTTLTML